MKKNLSYFWYKRSIEKKTVDDCRRLNSWVGNQKMIKKRQMAGGVI
jgi:hypothetical protein